MQIIRKGGLIQVLSQHLKEQKLVLKSPLGQDLQQDLQRLLPSRQEFECKYLQMLGRKLVYILLVRS